MIHSSSQSQSSSINLLDLSQSQIQNYQKMIGSYLHLCHDFKFNLREIFRDFSASSKIIVNQQNETQSIIDRVALVFLNLIQKYKQIEKINTSESPDQKLVEMLILKNMNKQQKAQASKSISSNSESQKNQQQESSQKSQSSSSSSQMSFQVLKLRSQSPKAQKNSKISQNNQENSVQSQQNINKEINSSFRKKLKEHQHQSENYQSKNIMKKGKSSDRDIDMRYIFFSNVEKVNLSKTQEEKIITTFFSNLSIATKLKYIKQCLQSLKKLQKSELKLNFSLNQLKLCYSIPSGKFQYLLLSQNQNKIEQKCVYIYHQFFLSLLKVLCKESNFQKSQQLIHKIYNQLQNVENEEKKTVLQILQEYQKFFVFIYNDLTKNKQILSLIFQILSTKKQLKISKLIDKLIQTCSQYQDFLNISNQLYSKGKKVQQKILNNSVQRSNNVTVSFGSLNQSSSQASNHQQRSQTRYINQNSSIENQNQNLNDSRSNILQQNDQTTIIYSNSINVNNNNSFDEFDENSSVVKRFKQLKERFNNNFNDFTFYLSQILYLLSQVSEVPKLFEGEFIQFETTDFNIFQMNKLFKLLQLKYKAKIIFDLISSAENIIPQIQRQNMNIMNQNISCIFIRFDISKKKFIFHPNTLPKMIEKQFPLMILKMLLDQNCSQQKQLNQIISQHLNQLKVNQLTKQKILQKKLKQFVLSQDLTTKQNNKIAQIFLKLILKTQTQQNSQNESNSQIQFKEDLQRIKQDLTDIFKAKTETYCFIFEENGQNSYLRNDQSYNMSEEQMDIFDMGDMLSNINTRQELLSKQKQKIITWIQKNQKIYSKYVFYANNVIGFQNNKKNFNVNILKHLENFYLKIQYINIKNHQTFRQQGLKVLTSIRFQNLRILLVWNCNIHTLEGSGLENFQNLQNFTCQYNPLDVRTVKYFQKHCWPKLIQLRLVFTDSNTSWPLMVSDCILKSFPNLTRLRACTQGQFKKQDISQETKQKLKSLQKQQKGITIL